MCHWKSLSWMRLQEGSKASLVPLNCQISMPFNQHIYNGIHRNAVLITGRFIHCVGKFIGFQTDAARMSYHVSHQSQLNTQSSRLSPHTPSLLENPLTFFTNTRHTFTTLPSVLFYKEGLYISMQHSSKHWRGSLFTSSPHHHLVRVGVNTSTLILIVSILF
jgi:hypothetical protein